MKILITLLTGLMLVVTADAAIKAVSVAEAQEQAKKTNSDYVVFVYGKGWDHLSTQYKARVWDQPETQAQLEPNTLVCEIYLAENPTEEEQNAQKERNKGFGETVRSYPSVFMFGKDGSCYAALGGKDNLPNNSNAVARKMAQLQRLARKRDAIMAQAGKAEGVQKAKLIGTAYDLPNLRHNNKEMLKEIKKADPDDKSGYVRRLSFSAWDLHQYLDKEKFSKEEALKVMDEMLKDPAYTTVQKQEILGVRGTLLRRNKTEKSELSRNYLMMKKLDPNSMYGKAADQAIEHYAK